MRCTWWIMPAVTVSDTVGKAIVLQVLGQPGVT